MKQCTGSNPLSTMLHLFSLYEQMNCYSLHMESNTCHTLTWNQYFFQQYNIDLCLVGETIRYIASNISQSCKNKCICLHVKSIAVSASWTFLVTLVVHGSFLHVYQSVSLGPVKHKSMLNVLFRMNSICLTRILCLLEIIF